MLRLLIVDDEVIVRKWLTLVFQPFDKEFVVVDAAANGHEALEICACDNPEELTVISKQQPFEIREAGLSRGQGVPTKQAVIKQDVKYYIILESKHEISIKATKRC